MPDNDLPVVMAVADRIANPGPLTEQQRIAALQLIEQLQLSMPVFLGNVQRLINGNDEDAMSVHRIALQGHGQARILHDICKAIWVMENDAIANYRLGNPPLGREETH